MKFAKTVLSVAVLAAAFALSAGTASAGGKGITALATGSGQITRGGEWRTFEFTALTDASGVSSGQGELHSRSGDLRVHLNVTCLSVQGNVAVVSGTVSDSTNAAFPFGVGNSILFAVMDNGEGANAPPDEISLTFFDAPHTFDTCASFNWNYFTSRNATFPIEAGNVQVH